MGRKPNPLILEYFERGPKLNDNSNRYPHTCKQCGENFPKGRIDSLTAHITKKCPAISDSERMRACLELHGIAHVRASAAERHHHQGLACDSGQPPPPAALPQGWSALETLAEASRQVDLSENNGRTAAPRPAAAAEPGPVTPDATPESHGLELREQYTLHHPPVGYESQAQQQQGRDDSIVDTPAAAATPAPAPAPTPDRAHAALDGAADSPPAAHTPSTPVQELSPEERLQELLPVNSSPDPSNMSVAVAAAARLNPSLLDPQLVHHDQPALSPAMSSQDEAAHVSPHAETGASQPWGEITYMSTTTAASPAATATAATAAAAAAAVSSAERHPPPPPPPLTRGGVRMDTSGPLFHGRSRHFRSKFTPTRRQEVKEVRKLGACIRCRILRKICSRGTPCDTCRKVLAPRVWMTGCVRSRLHEQLDLYSAGVQVVLSQNRINLHKDQLQLTDVGSLVRVSHFPDTGKHIELATLAVLLEPAEAAHGGGEGGGDDGGGDVDDEASPARDRHQVIMINQDKEEVPYKIETYVRDVLPLFMEREPSRFMRVTLDTAARQLEATDDELLRKAIELWGLVESIDRERQWTIVERLADDGGTRPIREAQTESDIDIYTMVCMQLNAAAERKANATSRALLNLMDRRLTDSKTKAGFRTFLSALIFLNCAEKSTWAFKAWEQHHLRPGWPLERDPGVFTQQGANLAVLLKMLLGIRKALPQTVRAKDGKLATTELDSAVSDYFQSLDLDCAFPPCLSPSMVASTADRRPDDAVQARQKGSQFSPADSRSLELFFCSHLLLPYSGPGPSSQGAP